MKKKTQGKPAKRQHFIPQLLLRGFASRVDGDKYYAFEFRTKGEPRETAIRNIALEGYFYGQPGQTEIEQIIARKENRYGPLVQALRQGGCNPQQKPLIDEFVNHLMVRTRTLRNSVVEPAQALLEIFSDELERPENRPCVQRMVLKQVRTDSRIRRQLNQLPQAKRQAALRQMESSIVNSADTIEMLKLIVQLAKPMIDLPKAAREAQVKTLETDQALEKRADLLKVVQWSVVEYYQHALVLGDLGPIAKTTASAEWQQPIVSGEPALICLPISSKHLLIGQRDTLTATPQPEAINIASVELSREIFVASQDTARERDYQSWLGRRATLIDRSDLQDIVQEGLKEK